MLYCSKCGKEIQDNSSFCVHCGAQVDSKDQFRPIQINQQQEPANNYFNSRRNIREAELRELDNMINYFSQKESEYNEMNFLSKEIVSAKNVLAQTPIAGIVFTTFSVCFWFLTIAMFSGYNKVGGYIMMVLAIILGIPGAILLTVYFVSRGIKKSKLKKYSPRYDELCNELTQYYSDYGYCPIGIEYTNLTDLQAIKGTIQSGYADTSKDAVNYLMQKYHNETMEREAAATRKATTATAVIGAAHFILRR